MQSRNMIILIAAVVFLVLAGANLFRLLYGFPIIVGGIQVGGTASFFMMVIFAALSLMLFRATRT